MITEKNHINLLTEHKVELIKSIEDIKKLFEPESLNKGDIPKINTEYDSMIFFDTSSYNSNYLAELIIKYLNNYRNISFRDISNFFNFSNKNIVLEMEWSNNIREKIINQTNKTKFYYCQDDNIYAQLFEKYLNTKLNRISDGDNKLQIPLFLTIKGNSEILIDFENISTLGYKNIVKNMVYLYDFKLINPK